MKLRVEIPSFDAMLEPTISALRLLGSSGSITEINKMVAEQMELSDEVRDLPHGNTSVSELDYRLAWSRTYLKKFGLLENSRRGVWSLTEAGKQSLSIDPKEIVTFVRSQLSVETKSTSGSVDLEADMEALPTWEESYLKKLLELAPAAFERLVMRMLRESGFTQVEVTGRSGDGGIDGIGIARIHGFLSFRVLFQCKRYQGSVGPGDIRDFRGAMQGRTDKGLFATTGTFTSKAIAEATRDGAPPIDILDGRQLVIRLKELGLGVDVKMVEVVELDEAWFDLI